MSDVTTELAKEASDKAMEIARLKSDNAKLRDDADLLRAMLSQVQTEKRCYMAENSKLRELVRDMWEGYNDPRCEECHLKDTPTCADCPICAREASVIDRMRELGVDA